MKKLYFLFPLLFLCTALSAQTIKITGTVSDSLGNPLKMANIIAKSKADSTAVGFAIANRQGFYKIGLRTGQSYILIASFMGMQPVKEDLEIPEDAKDRVINFRLMPKSNRLKGVKMVYEMPVTIKGDTIIYNTGSFTNGNEEKLGDVLKKLPGFDVNDKGDVKVQGKKVSKVMVEGKDFFGGNTRLATKNIPADVLDKVEVLRNYNEIGQLDKVQDNRDNIALNIKLKKDKKKFWFGEVEAGLGYGKKTRYDENSRLFYYSPKTSINLIGNLNNAGEVPFTFMDYFHFMGGLSAFANGNTINLSEAGLGFLMAQNKRAYDSKNGFGAANFTYTPSKKWTIGGFLIYSDNQTRFINRSLRQYVDTQIMEKDSSQRKQHNQLGLFRFKADFKPGDSLRIRYNALVKTSEMNSNSDALSVFKNGSATTVNPVGQRNESTPRFFKQRVAAYYTLNDQTIFAGQFQYTVKKADPFYEAMVKTRPFPGIVPLDTTQTRYHINQDQLTKTNKFNGNIDYYYVLNKKSNLKFSLGLTDNRQKFNSSIFQTLDSGQHKEFTDPTFNNKVDYHFQDLYFGARYKILSGIFTFAPGLYIHRYRTQTIQQGKTTTEENDLLLPQFYTTLQFQKSESLRLSYRMSANFPSVQQMAEAYVFNNYNYLFSGNRDLENALFHRVSLRYAHFNNFNFTNMNFHLGYTRKVDAVVGRSLLVLINQVSRPMNSDFPSENFRARGSFQKTLRKIIIKADADLNFGRYTNILNHQEQKVQNLGQDYKLSLESNLDHFPNLEIGYEQRINRYDNGNLAQTFYTGRLFAKAEINFLKNLNLTAKYSYFNYTDKAHTMRNRYSFLNAKLTFKTKNKHWEFALKGKNLMDVERINRNGVGPNYNYTASYFVQPRIFLFSVKYKL